MHCDLNAEQLKHERFEELCALAAIGELSASEFAELNEHLPGCDHCRELYADFRRTASHDMGVIAAAHGYGDDSIGPVDEAALLKGVLARAHEERVVTSETPPGPETRKPRSPRIPFHSLPSSRLLRAAALVACCAVVALVAYKYGYRHQQAPPPSAVAARLASSAAGNPAAPRQSLDQDERSQHMRAQIDSLQAALAGAHAQYTAMLDQQKTLQAEISVAREQARKDAKDLQSSKLKAEQSEAQIRELQSKLQEAIANGEAQALALNELNEKLRRAEEETTLAAASGIQDADAKNLFGARDLHIVDVYDVDGNGKTKHAFGRVYYAERRLLLFYAFDLQAKQNTRRTAGFQAWGYRQGDEDKPHNLGLFLMDDPTVSRWVLKVNDARVLEHVDAVFVTLEPPNGSPSPSGRRLLYANLGGPPNHP